MISFTCPACGFRVETDDFMKGRSAPCPGCGASVTVPSAERPPAAPPAPPASAAAAPEAAPAGAMSGVEDEDRCAKCGSRISAGSVSCGFCGASLGRGLPGPAQPSALEKKVVRRSALRVGICTLWILAMAGVIGLMLAAPGAAPPSPDEEASGNLLLLHNALERMLASGKTPVGTGGAFWIEVAEAEDAKGALVSQAAARQGFTGATSVRGPARPFAQIPEKGVLGCERPGSLKTSIVILYKDGRVETVGEQSEEYRTAIKETQD